LTNLLWVWLEPHPTSLFLAAITISAWYGGFRPSLLATALAALVVDYYFIVPVHSLEISVDNIVRTCVFVFVALLISWIDSTRKRAIEECDQMLIREKEARGVAEKANWFISFVFGMKLVRVLTCDLTLRSGVRAFPR
jgi:K+-sensing histidine kinase KdpD